MIFEEWDEFVESGNRVDWTDKVDVDGAITITPMNARLRNPIYLSYQRDGGDVLNAQYEESTDLAFGSHEEVLPIAFTEGKGSEVELFYPAPQQEIIGSTPAADFPEFIICKYYEDEGNLNYKPPGWQLMYKNGMKTVAQFYTKDTEGSVAVARTAYPYFSHFKFNNVNFEVDAD
ncbi:unnamed protein product, partial [marine sediment metagenome]